jgi:nucleotide-binding universal stress UspA family protein
VGAHALTGRNILAATDGSPGGDRAVDAAAELAKASGAALHIINVQEHPSREAVDAFKAVEGVGESDVAEVAAQGILARALHRVRDLGVRETKTMSEIGDAAQHILQAAARLKTDAIVVGKRGRGPLAALLLGSVSQKLVSLAPCKVIVVP